MTRREFLAAAVCGGALHRTARGLSAAALPVIRPPRLNRGDTVALLSPAGATFLSVELDIARESLEALGLKVRPGDHLLNRRGYLAGSDAERARDVNALFADATIKAILPVRGGWGSARLLPLLDYDTIRRHPKVLMGFSDITALLLAVHARTGLVTFHGPNGLGAWRPFTVEHVRRVLFEAEAVVMENLRDPEEHSLAQLQYRVQAITGGTARGRILGGNLTVLSAIVGSGFLPDWSDAILFLEDVREDIYRVDRMLTQLKLAGILDRLRGFIFGSCHECGPGEGYGSLTLEEVLDDHVRPLGIPAWQGAMIGHQIPQFTIPLGVEVEIDADRGTIRMLEPAVR